jgi:hypothetical protein
MLVIWDYTKSGPWVICSHRVFVEWSVTFNHELSFQQCLACMRNSLIFSFEVKNVWMEVSRKDCLEVFRHLCSNFIYVLGR